MVDLHPVLPEQREGPEPRFWSKVDRSGGPDACWPWLGSRSRRQGYGFFSRIRSRAERAHRVAYEMVVGPIPDGLQIDHLCRNPPCVNPAHLEAVTSRENTLRGNSSAAVKARQTHCWRGHLLAGDNLKIDGRGYRRCVPCHRADSIERQRLIRAARRDARLLDGAVR